MARIGRFAPPLALMALIYFLSDQPDLNSGLGSWDLYLRKAAHMTEYALLVLLWWRALRTPSPLPALAITIAYAVTDEWHQSFVDGRHAAATDVLIDATGALLGVLAFRASRAR